jgi:catechol 2,3-dioxygenase-like lactoylglutathione lyase family enzyme/flavodoxin
MKTLRLNHIGWVTNNQALFEKFWVDIIGAEKISESYISEDMSSVLFGKKFVSKCVKYEYNGTILEIHIPTTPDKNFNEMRRDFFCYGINHICFMVDDREQFLKNLPDTVEVKIFNNPKGWKNIFIRDFEGNWIEIKEPFGVSKIFSTSYRDEIFEGLLTTFIRIVNPKTVVELGVQQGKSAIQIAKGLGKDSKLYAYDLFQEKYSLPPYSQTHANFEETLRNLSNTYVNDKVVVLFYDAFQTHLLHDKVDVLHIDLCNHYDNVKKILELWSDKVTKMILIEGGYENHWHRKYGFKAFTPVLDESFIKDNYHVNIICSDNKNYALTVLIRKVIK